jgi:hypothetical protein
MHTFTRASLHSVEVDTLSARCHVVANWTLALLPSKHEQYSFLEPEALRQNKTVAFWISANNPSISCLAGWQSGGMEQGYASKRAFYNRRQHPTTHTSTQGHV